MIYLAAGIKGGNGDHNDVITQVGAEFPAHFPAPKFVETLRIVGL